MRRSNIKGLSKTYVNHWEGKKMVTIKEVAADAGVSVGTVSKVLNNMYVKADNRRRVEESAGWGIR